MSFSVSRRIPRDQNWMEVDPLSSRSSSLIDESITTNRGETRQMRASFGRVRRCRHASVCSICSCWWITHAIHCSWHVIHAENFINFTVSSFAARLRQIGCPEGRIAFTAVQYRMHWESLELNALDTSNPLRDPFEWTIEAIYRKLLWPNSQ